MFCRNCDAELGDGAIACTKCGMAPLSGRKFCSRCSAETNPDAIVCVACGSSLVKQGEPVSGKALGITSVILGALTFGIQMVGGIFCGWIGWPLGIAALICGAIAIKQGDKVLGIIGCVLSIIGVIIQIAIAMGLIGALNSGQPVHHYGAQYH